MKVKGDRIVIEELLNTTIKTESGLLLPNTHKENNGVVGEIKYLGTGETIKEYDLKVGDIVVSHRMNAGTPIAYKGKPYLCMDANAVFYTTDEEFLKPTPEEEMAITAVEEIQEDRLG